MNEAAWDLLVARDELNQSRFVDHPVPVAGTGEALLRVDRVGVTANNVTYALMGEAMNYWNFFPTEPGWGRVPLWGFADVVQSNVSGVDVGSRVYGYLPTSSHLIVQPDRADGAGFRDGSEHRAGLPSPYNVYATTSGDPAYDADREDLQILYRPLFITSFMLDDFLADNDFFGADTIVMSSASSKTSYGTAFCIGLREPRPRIVGLTSGGNVGFTHKLGCYDEVVSYEDVTSTPAERPTMYVDMAGDAPLRETIHDHFGDRLVYDAIVGVTHLDQTALSASVASGPEPAFFFAPTQMKKRRADWGPGGIEKRYGAVWRRFVPVVEGWVDVTVSNAREGLR
ncbi:MAG: DUF2855 family protein, partial [Actinomycetota bacterium]